MAQTNPDLTKREQEIADFWKKDGAKYIIPGGVLILTVGIVIGGLIFGAETPFTTNNNLLNFSRELFMHIITIIVIVVAVDRVSEYRATQRLKRHLVAMAGSQIHSQAIAAVEEIKFNGWLIGKNSILAGASLGQPNLERVEMWYANLQGIGLSGANLRRAQLGSADLRGAFLMGITLDDAILWETNFLGATLSGASFREAELVHANMVDVDLWHCNFSGAKLNKANLKGVNLEQGDLQGAELAFTNLQGANMEWVNLQGAFLGYTNLENANMVRTTIYDTRLSNVNLQNANLEYANLYEAQLADTNLSGANLTNVNLGLADLSSANLSNANLTNANLSGAILIFKRDEDNIKRTIFDENTILPDGTNYDPEKGLDQLARFGAYTQALTWDDLSKMRQSLGIEIKEPNDARETRIIWNKLRPPESEDVVWSLNDPKAIEGIEF